MGTRSIIRVIDGDVVLMHMYQQFDGYLDGVGKQLYSFLKDMHIVNGYNDRTPKPFANGAGCLAAQIVKNFKTSLSGGGCYLFPITAGGEEYNYDVIVTEPASWDSEGDLRVKVEYYGKSFEGTVEEFGAFISNPPAEDEDEDED